MSRTLILELSDEIHEAILNYSEKSGTSPAQLVINSLEKQFGILKMLNAVNNSDNEISLAREKFENHFGEIDLGYPTGADNESIDLDLEKEYEKELMVNNAS